MNYTNYRTRLRKEVIESSIRQWVKVIKNALDRIKPLRINSRVTKLA